MAVRVRLKQVGNPVTKTRMLMTFTMFGGFQVVMTVLEIVVMIVLVIVVMGMVVRRQAVRVRFTSGR
jgi:uncharacterized membrane protein